MHLSGSLCKALPVLLFAFACVKKTEPAPQGTDTSIIGDTGISENKPYVLETPFHFGYRFTIPENNPLTTEGVKLGRMLFYEKKLSQDNSISCASCHLQSKAFTDGQAVSLGVGGVTGRRSAQALANLLWDDRFFWDGRSNSLEAQALEALASPLEMNLDPSVAATRLQTDERYPKRFKAAFGSETVTPENIGKALAQFERTMISQNAKLDKYYRGEYTATASEINGLSLFQTHIEPSIGARGGECVHCHGAGFLTQIKGAFHNNGLDSVFTDKGLEEFTGNPADRGKFKAPSLRNIALTAPYMHDGRFKTLEEVLDHYNEHLVSSSTLDPMLINASNVDGGTSLMLTEQEKKDIIAFLHMLTDTTFIRDPRFSNPFGPENE